jgi:maleylpyruvate isomerase
MSESYAADLEDLQESTRRLLATLDRLDDGVVRRPSLLPGWTVGHVITHLARNADGMARIAEGAITGDDKPMYASADARTADIEAGSGRPAAELAADARDSAARLAQALQRLGAAPEAALERPLVLGPPRPDAATTPAHTLPHHRRREVEIHHVDLGVGYGPADWPLDFVERTLLQIHSRTGPIDVVGDPAEVLAWRIGRGAGPSVRHLDGSPPGEPPAGW